MYGKWRAWYFLNSKFSCRTCCSFCFRGYEDAWCRGRRCLSLIIIPRRRRYRSGVRLSSTRCDSTHLGSTSCGKRRRSWAGGTAWNTRWLRGSECSWAYRSSRRCWHRPWWDGASGHIAGEYLHCTPRMRSSLSNGKRCRVSWWCACSHAPSRTG